MPHDLWHSDLVKPHRALRIHTHFSRGALGFTTIVVGCITACSPDAGDLTGLDMQALDAIYVTTEDPNRPSEKNTSILIASVDDLCERLRSGDTLAGHEAIWIRSRYTGSAFAEYQAYDGECQVMDEDSSSDAWAKLEQRGTAEIGVDFTFRGNSKIVSGRVSARYCQETLIPLRCDASP